MKLIDLNSLLGNAIQNSLSNGVITCVCGKYCKFIEVIFSVKDIPEIITFGNGNSMVAT
jgi:hypothetical protein